MKEKILELRKNGLSYVEIQKQLGCSKSTISYNCKKNGLTDIGLKDKKRKLRGTKICENCNIEFSLTGLSKDRIFCCKECYNKSEKKRKEGRNFGLYSSQIQKERRRSKNEIYFFELCKEKYEEVLSNEAIFNGWDADVIIVNYKVAILWNGKWHYEKIKKQHSVKQVQNRDSLKIKEIKSCGYLPYVIKDMGRENKDFVKSEFEKLTGYISSLS
jgi:IS30 family transposase